MTAEWMDESDCVGAWQNERLAAVLFPTADTLPQVRQMARVKGPHRLMLVINPQWQTDGQIVSDFGYRLPALSIPTKSVCISRSMAPCRNSDEHAVFKMQCNGQVALLILLPSKLVLWSCVYWTSVVYLVVVWVHICPVPPPNPNPHLITPESAPVPKT